MAWPQGLIVSTLAPVLLAVGGVGTIVYVSVKAKAEPNHELYKGIGLESEADPAIALTMHRSEVKRAITRGVIDSQLTLLEGTAAFQQMQDSPKALLSLDSVLIPWGIRLGIIATPQITREELLALQVIWWANHMLQEMDHPTPAVVLERLANQFRTAKSQGQFHKLPEVPNDTIQQLYSANTQSPSTPQTRFPGVTRQTRLTIQTPANPG